MYIYIYILHVCPYICTHVYMYAHTIEAGSEGVGGWVRDT
jgi:hypothetical protein